jgi:hypothetical protein
MASSSKKRTTMAKIARENKLRERRIDKQARKDARKNGTFEDASEQPLAEQADGEDVLQESTEEPGTLTPPSGDAA